jgi:hypothetical protein
MFNYRRTARLVAIAAATAAVSPSWAAEGPVVEVVVKNVNRIHTITPSYSSVEGFKPHINFPWMEQRGDGSLLAWWSIGQIYGPGHTGAASQSFDGGDTWTPPTTSFSITPTVTHMKPAGQLSRGYEINFSGSTPRTTFTAPRYTSTDGGYNWTNSTASYNTNGVGYVNLYQQQGPLVEHNGELFFTAYGQRNVSDTTFESVLFASTNNGQNWTRRSTISAYVPGLNLSMGEEGPSETSIIALDNGSLLSVFRTGQPYPNGNINAVNPSIFSSISGDGGYTWSTPKMLGVVGVSPHLNKLPDGEIALTYGRYGAKIMFADPTGTRWSFPTTILAESTSGHVRMLEKTGGDWIYAYDHSSFYHPSNNASPPSAYVYDNDQSAHMEMATLELHPKVVVDDYQWAFEYHGDVPPDELSIPWTRTQSGTTSVRTWGDLGQDYLRTDSGSTGSSRSIYYNLSGSTPSSPWTDVNFQDGLVLDVRARAGSTSTDPGAASIFLGDGENGYIILELTSSYVGLEGLGGNGSQVNYLPSGFSAREWHDYRLIVAPDDSSGVITAKLFMDGNWGQEILSQQLNSAIVDELRIGDQTGTNNGILDIDYLRFAHLSESSNLLGDYNLDGRVDAADYSIWRDAFGLANESSLNGNGDGMNGVDEGDYLLWKSQFGATLGGAGQLGTHSVPEPTSGFLLGSIAVCAVATWRLGRRWASGSAGCSYL